MKVRLNFNNTGEPKNSVTVNMESLPRVGESLVSGTAGMCEVLKVIHTPETSEQDVVVELGPQRSG